MAFFKISRRGISPSLGFSSSPPHRLPGGLRCRLMAGGGGGDFCGGEPPEPLFIKEMPRRGLSPMGGRGRVGVMEMGRRGENVERNGVVVAEFDQGMLGRRVQSLALHSEGSETPADSAPPQIPADPANSSNQSTTNEPCNGHFWAPAQPCPLTSFQFSRSGLSPSLGLGSSPPRRLPAGLRCHRQVGSGGKCDTCGGEPPESLFLTELLRRGLSPTGGRGRVGVEVMGWGEEIVTRNEMVPAEFVEGVWTSGTSLWRWTAWAWRSRRNRPLHRFFSAGRLGHNSVGGWGWGLLPLLLAMLFGR